MIPPCGEDQSSFLGLRYRELLEPHSRIGFPPIPLRSVFQHTNFLKGSAQCWWQDLHLRRV